MIVDFPTACAECRRLSTWPIELSGKRVRCPHCLAVFAADPVPPDEAIAEVEAVAEPPPVAGRPRLTPEALAFFSDAPEQPLGPDQRTVYALLVRAFQSKKRSMAGRVVLTLLVLPLVPVVLLLAYGLLVQIGQLLDAVPEALRTLLLLLVPLGFFSGILARRYLRRRAGVRLGVTAEGRMDAIELGEPRRLVRSSPVAGWLLAVGILSGFQLGVIEASPDHLGLTSPGGLAEAIRLSHSPGEHTFLSATVFLGFRSAIGLIFGLIAYDAYRWWRVQQLLNRVPIESRSPQTLAEWLGQCCNDEHGWARQFFDEMFFLLLAAEYLRGHFELVEVLAGRFPQIDVAPEVRRLFVDPDGILLFDGAESCS